MIKQIPIIGSLGRGYFRVIELLAILVILTAAILVGRFALNKLKDEGNKVGELQKQSTDLRDQIRLAKKTIEDEKNPTNNTQAIIDNLQVFQTKFLKDQQQGRLYVINQINKLVKNNGLSLTGGISFEKLEATKAEKEKLGERTRGNTQRQTASALDKTLYPALDASFSVAGNYTSFRKFLYALETDKMFFVISSLNLQTPDSEAKASVAGGNSQRIASVQRTIQQNPGEITVQVSVKAYFRKEENATN